MRTEARGADDPMSMAWEGGAGRFFFKGTNYHNLVTFKGRDQDYRDPKHAVVLERVAFGGACDYLSADLRNSYQAFAQYRRRVLFVRPHYFLILDDVQADEPGLEWNYHSCAPFEKIDLASGVIRLRGGQAGMLLAIGLVVDDAMPPHARTTRSLPPTGGRLPPRGGPAEARRFCNSWTMCGKRWR